MKLKYLMMGICLIALVGCSSSKEIEPEIKDFVNEVVNMTDVSVEVVDEMYYIDETIHQWVEEYKSEAGVYKKEIGDYQYLLLAGGEKETTGYAMAFLKTILRNDKVYVMYSVVEPQDGDEVVNELSYPFMLVRISNKIGYELDSEYVDDFDFFNGPINSEE